MLTDDEKLDVLFEKYLAIMEKANHDLEGTYLQLRIEYERRKGKL